MLGVGGGGRSAWRSRSQELAVATRAGAAKPARLLQGLWTRQFSCCRATPMAATLATVIPEIETQIGANLVRIVADRGYRGHSARPDHKFQVYVSGQRRRVTETIKRELRRRPAVESVIGDVRAERRMGQNDLAGTLGDAANAVFAAAGYDFRRRLLAALNPATGRNRVRLIFYSARS